MAGRAAACQTVPRQERFLGKPPVSSAVRRASLWWRFQIFVVLFVSKFCTNLLHRCEAIEFRTLELCIQLQTLSRFSAPFAPFLPDEIGVSLYTFSFVLGAGDAGGLVLPFTVRARLLSCFDSDSRSGALHGENFDKFRLHFVAAGDGRVFTHGRVRSGVSHCAQSLCLGA